MNMRQISETDINLLDPEIQTYLSMELMSYPNIFGIYSEEKEEYYQ